MLGRAVKKVAKSKQISTKTTAKQSQRKHKIKFAIRKKVKHHNNWNKYIYYYNYTVTF